VGAARRIVEIVSDEGTLNNASGAAGVSMASVMGTWATQDVVSNAFAKMLLSSETYRSEAMACWNPGISGQVIAGLGRRGDPYTTALLDCCGGGGGARTFADGVDSAGAMQSMSMTIPNVETTENRYPVLQVYRRERGDSGGHGRFRGGLGIEYGLMPHKTAVPVVDIVFGSGFSQPEGHGLSGGGPAAVGYNLDQFAAGGIPDSGDQIDAGAREVLAAKQATQLEGDDLHILLVIGGGAYGDPLLRDTERVLTDLSRGRVSPETVRSVYGVVVSNGAVDEEATGSLRNEIRRTRLAQSTRVDEAVGGGRAEGSHLHPVADTLEAVEDEHGAAIRCTRCSYRLSGYGEDYKRGSAMRELPITALSPLNAYGLVDEIVVREYCCPGCGTLIAVDVQKKGEPVLPEARFGV
jgi:N-methylhydantoinase B